MLYQLKAFLMIVKHVCFVYSTVLLFVSSWCSGHCVLIGWHG